MRYQVVNFVLALFMAALFAGCLGEEKKASMPQLPPPTVSTQVVAVHDVPLRYHYPARLISAHEVEVVAKVPGTLVAQHFKEGDMVKKGDLLYEIDPNTYKARYEQALSSFEVQKTLLESATRTWKRAQALQKSNAISQQEYDDALGAYESAKASLELAKVNVQLAKIDLDDATIEATISGVIGQTNVDVGNYISSANVPLVTITQLDPIHVEFSLPQRDYFIIKPSLDTIKLRIDGPDGHSVEGRLIYTDAKVNDKTSTVTLKGSFENSSNLLLPGLFTRVYLEGLVLKDAITIPQKALVQDPSGTYVYIHKDGKALRVPVEIGEAVEGNFIIKSGLKGQEEIILDNLTKLRPNIPVQLAKG